jgi:hypothetical protein
MGGGIGHLWMLLDGLIGSIVSMTFGGAGFHFWGLKRPEKTIQV